MHLCNLNGFSRKKKPAERQNHHLCNANERLNRDFTQARERTFKYDKMQRPIAHQTTTTDDDDDNNDDVDDGKQQWESALIAILGAAYFISFYLFYCIIYSRINILWKEKKQQPAQYSKSISTSGTDCWAAWKSNQERVIGFWLLSD